MTLVQPPVAVLLAALAVSAIQAETATKASTKDATGVATAGETRKVPALPAEQP